MKERHTKQGCCLECRTEADAQVTVLNLVDSASGDADPRCELVLRPAPLPPRKANLSAKQPGSLDCVR